MDHAIKGPRFEMKPKEVILDVNERNERQSPENDRQPQENDKQLQENGSQSQENDRQPQENVTQPQENDNQPQENDNQPQGNDNQPQENDRQPYENDNQPQENDRQKRDRLRRLLLEEAKKRQLEKKIKKTARRKARNKKLPSIAASSDQTSARSSPDYTNLSNGCFMEKTVSSLQKDESMNTKVLSIAASSDQTSARSSPVYTNLSNGCFMEKTVSSLQKDESMNKKVLSIAASSDQTSARSSPVYTNLSNGCFMEKTVSSLQKDESMMSSYVFDHHKPLHLGNFDILTDIDVNKSEDGITVVRKHQGSMMLKRAQMTLKEGQELLKTCVSSTSAVLQHLQAVSAFTLAVRGHCCLKFCNCFGDDDLSPCNLGAAEHCGTKCIDSDQPSTPCLSLLPSSSASDLLYIHQEAETEILSRLHKPQFQRHLPLNVGSMQLQGSLIKIILSHSLSQNYPETDTSKGDLKHKHGIVPYRKYLCQNLQQSWLQVILTKSLSGSVFCALMDMRYYQNNFTSWPFRPVLRDISCQMFSSQRRSSLKKCNATSSARSKVQVAERVCEASGDKIDVAVDRCKADVCQSEQSLKEMHTFMQCENDESVPTTAAQFVPGIASFENTEFTHVDEVSQNVEFYSLTAADRHADLESCQDTQNHITDEVPQNVGYSTFLDRNPYPESCRGTQNHTYVEVSQNFKDYSLTATIKIAAVHSCQDTHGNTSDKGYLRDEHLLNERKVASDLWCPIRQEFVPDNWDDGLSSDEDIIDSASNCVMTDASISTPAPTTPHRELFVESCIEIDNNEKQCRKQQYLDVEISEQNISCCQEVVKNVTGVCDNKPKQIKGKVCDVRKVDKRKCEGNDQVTLPRMTVPLLPHTTVMSMQQQRKTECLHQEHQLLNKPELKLHQSTDLGSFTEAERNKSNDKVWLTPVSNQNEHQRLHTAKLLTNALNQFNDTEVELKAEQSDSISYLNKTFGALQNSSDMKNLLEDGVVNKESEFSSSIYPAGSLKICISADFVNLKEDRVIDDGKCELGHNSDIVENSLPGKCVPDGSAVINPGRNCPSHNTVCELDNSVHRKWEFIPDSVLKKGTAEASVNRPITDYECRQNADECLHERLTQGNSDSLIYAECYANQQIYNNALPVNNESTKYSIPNNSAQNFTTIHPTLLHPSTFPVASSNLCHGPTKSDLNNLLALTLEKEQERLYLLLCDLQAKVLELARMMKAHNIVKSPLAAEDDIDSFKSAGLLPGEKELSLEKIEAILDRFVLVANKCLIPATEHSSAKSIEWNKHAQRVQNTFPFQSDKREKQTNQREFSDAEVDNILKRLDMLYINDQKTPHTRGQSTAHSINQSSQDGSLNSDRYFQDPQFPSRLPKWPPGFEQKYRLGKASTQLQTQVSQNMETNTTVSSCQDGADQFILSRNSADVVWNRQELQGQMQLGNPRKSHTMAGSFTTADSPVNSTQENRTNIPKNITPYNLLRRRVIKMSDYSLSEEKHGETETRPDLGEVALPTKIGHSPPDFKEPSKSFSLSASALPVFRKNVAMQKTKSAHYSYCLPSLMERPVLAISKKLPKKADEFNSKDGW